MQIFETMAHFCVLAVSFHDLKLRVRMARKYLLDEIMRARDFIFNKGYTVGSAAVRGYANRSQLSDHGVFQILFGYWYITY